MSRLPWSDASGTLEASRGPVLFHGCPARAGRGHEPEDRATPPSARPEVSLRIPQINTRRTTVDVLEFAQQVNRRLLLARSGIGLGAMALGSLLDRDGVARADTLNSAGGRPPAAATGGLPGLPHFPPKAQRVIYL